MFWCHSLTCVHSLCYILLAGISCMRADWKLRHTIYCVVLMYCNGSQTHVQRYMIPHCTTHSQLTTKCCCTYMVCKSIIICFINNTDAARLLLCVTMQAYSVMKESESDAKDQKNYMCHVFAAPRIDFKSNTGNSTFCLKIDWAVS